VRAIGYREFGPATQVRQFTTSTGAPIQFGSELRLSDGRLAVLEVAGPAGADPCTGSESIDLGCVETGGNGVIGDPNSTDDYYVVHSRLSAGFAPHDFEIRFGPDDGLALDYYTDRVMRVPFTAWDIGSVGPFGENDPADDTQLIPMLDVYGRCDLAYGAGWRPDDLFGTWESASDINVRIPETTYGDFAAYADSVLTMAGADCSDVEPSWHPWGLSVWSVTVMGNPLGPNYAVGRPADGTVLRALSTSHGTSSPAPAAPRDGAMDVGQPVRLDWNLTSAQGLRPQYSEVQVATSPLFDDDELVFSEEMIAELVMLPPLDSGATYYWRVRSSVHYEVGFSEWSRTWQFTAGVGVALEDSEALPEGFGLWQNYPNPFNGRTIIEYGLPEAAAVTVEVYNLLGQSVRVLESGFRPGGAHQVGFDGAGLASGVYLYTLKARDRVLRRTMVLVR
jgi:hypothetical protein